MTYADFTQRTRFIAGLRELADYLESNQEVPVPSYSNVLTFPAKGDWAEMCAEIDATAARLDVTTYENGSHYVAARTFGTIEYRAVAIPPKNDSGNEESEQANVPDSRSGRRGGLGCACASGPRRPDYRNSPG